MKLGYTILFVKDVPQAVAYVRDLDSVLVEIASQM